MKNSNSDIDKEFIMSEVVLKLKIYCEASKCKLVFSNKTEFRKLSYKETVDLVT